MEWNPVEAIKRQSVEAGRARKRREGNGRKEAQKGLGASSHSHGNAGFIRQHPAYDATLPDKSGVPVCAARPRDLAMTRKMMDREMVGKFCVFCAFWRLYWCSFVSIRGST